MEFRTFSLFALLAVLFAACAPSAGSGQPELAGTEWMLFSLNGEQVTTDAGPTIRFNEEEVGGSGGCNSYGGTYQVDAAEGNIAIGWLVSTLMACSDDEVSRLEGDFLAALERVENYAISGENALRLYGVDAELVFYPLP